MVSNMHHISAIGRGRGYAGRLLADRVVNLMEDQVELAVRCPTVALSRPGSARSAAWIAGVQPIFAAHGTPKSPGELSTHACVTFEGLTSPDAWIFTTDKSDISVVVHSRLVVNTAEAAIDAAIAGLGMTRVLSYQIASAAQAGALNVVLQEFEAASLPVSLTYTGQRPLPLKLRAFLDFAAARLKARILESAQ